MGPWQPWRATNRAGAAAGRPLHRPRQVGAARAMLAHIRTGLPSLGLVSHTCCSPSIRSWWAAGGAATATRWVCVLAACAGTVGCHQLKGGQESMCSCHAAQRTITRMPPTSTPVSPTPPPMLLFPASRPLCIPAHDHPLTPPPPPPPPATPLRAAKRALWRGAAQPGIRRR